MGQHRSSKTRQTGFSAIEITIAVLVVGVIVTSGLLVYQRYRITSKQAANVSSSQTTNQQKNPTSTLSAPTSYLDIKEWGIKLPLSEGIKDAHYISGVGSKGNDGLTNQMWLGFRSLNSNGCTPTNYSGPALLFRSMATDVDPVTNRPYRQEYPNGVILGGHLYAYEDFTTGSGNTCTAPEATLQTLDSSLTAAERGIISDTTNTNIIKIPELGIQLTVAASIKDLIYKVGTTTLRNGNPATYAMFSTASLTAAEPSCGPDFGPFGSLERASGQYPDLSDGQYAPIDFGVLEAQFPTFYISAGFPQAACSTSGTALPGYDRGAFDDALSTIQPLK